MAVEEPVGFTAAGELITAFRLTEADVADIGMAGELYAASPDGQSHYRSCLDSLEPGSIEISGFWDAS